MVERGLGRQAGRAASAPLTVQNADGRARGRRRTPTPLRAGPGGGGQPFFFLQAEDGIRDLQGDWSSDVCSSDLDSGPRYGLPWRLVFRYFPHRTYIRTDCSRLPAPKKRVRTENRRHRSVAPPHLRVRYRPTGPVPLLSRARGKTGLVISRSS